MVSVAKANVGKVAETAKANKLKRNEVNCGRDIAILHEKNKKCWLPGLIPGWLAKNKFIYNSND
ncbi:hypothetical protein A4R38_04270 [Escherichia coli]|nr:hypothetical protein A4R38_04270 [Escherichia coli]